jgi:hypothetical protein
LVVNEQEKPLSPMKELHTDLMVALKETVADALKPEVTIEVRARVLEHCARAFSAIGQALTERIAAIARRDL